MKLGRKQQAHTPPHEQLPLPNDASLQKIAEIMEKQLREKRAHPKIRTDSRNTGNFRQGSDDF